MAARFAGDQLLLNYGNKKIVITTIYKRITKLSVCHAIFSLKMKFIFFISLLISIFVFSTSKLIFKPTASFKNTLGNHDLDFEQNCELKQGFLGLGELRDNGTILLARPIFAVLNQRILSLFEDEKVSSLIGTVDMRFIGQPERPKDWSDVLCFKVSTDEEEIKVLKKGGTKKKSKLSNPRGSFSKFKQTSQKDTPKNNNKIINQNPQKIPEKSQIFCLTDPNALKSWMASFVSFHNCLAHEGLKKISKSKKLHKLRATEPESPSFFDEETAKRDLDNELLKLKQDVLSDKLQEEKERARLENERRKIEAKTHKLEQQQRVLSRALQAKAIEEEKIAEVLIKQEENYKRNLILEQTRKALINETHKEKSMLIRQEEQLLRAEKSLQEQIKNMMVQSSYDFEKLLDFGECLSPLLTGGNTSYIKEMCYKFIEPNSKPHAESLVKCLDKTRFCEQCCEFFIGTSHETTRFKCKNKCDRVILPSFNVKTDNAYIVTLPQKNAIVLSNNNNSTKNITTTLTNATISANKTNSTASVVVTSLSSVSVNPGFILEGENKIKKENQKKL